MSLYLLDTCVLSELVKRDVDSRATSSLSTQPDDALRVSVISPVNWSGVFSACRKAGDRLSWLGG